MKVKRTQYKKALKGIALLAILCLAFVAKPNDGAYYLSGNHLIPMVENDISITKERLYLKRNRTTGRLQVYVAYEFYNPGPAKTITVGFEAESPKGDANPTPVNGGHPNMHNFSVLLNGNRLQYKKAIVMDSTYYQNGIVNSLTEKAAMEQLRDQDYADFYYVYHFEATFQPGKNTITHNYEFDLSGSVISMYEFDYVLTAANRWANKGIDDFELEINMGWFEEFSMANTFFDSPEEWEIEQGGKAYSSPHLYGENGEMMTTFNIQKKSIFFRKKNFKPTGELRIFANNFLEAFLDEDEFNPVKHQLPFTFRYYNFPEKAVDANAYKILRNLPYARRGYVFKTKLIQDYYEGLPWYKPDHAYKAELSDLLEVEQKWLQTIKQNQAN